MRARATLFVLAFLALPALSAEGPILQETEPNGFTVPAPMEVGTPGQDGLRVVGTLSPTSASGLAPGDSDGFAFGVTGGSGDLEVLLESPSPFPFLLALSEIVDGSPRLRAAVLGPSPLRLQLPGPSGEALFKVGVAAFGDGGDAPWELTLSETATFPPWTGAPCAAPAASTEPDGDAIVANDVEDFGGLLCGTGVLGALVDPSGEGEGDVDMFRFRNLLPLPARLLVRADPGTVRVEVDHLNYVGLTPVASRVFGEETALELPVLAPGMEYVVRLSASHGQVPLAYSWHLEPVAIPPEEAATGLALAGGRLRKQTEAAGGPWSVDGEFDPTEQGPLLPDGTGEVRVGGVAFPLPAGALEERPSGLLRWRAPPGSEGLRLVRIDPLSGRLRLKGRGRVVEQEELLRVELERGEFRVGGQAELEPSRNGRVLRVAPPAGEP